MKKFFLFAFVLVLMSSCAKEVKVGQTWLYVINFRDNDNPFKESILFYQKVIAVKGSYVLYVENGKDTLSCKKSYFTIGNELQK